MFWGLSCVRIIFYHLAVVYLAGSADLHLGRLLSRKVAVTIKEGHASMSLLSEAGGDIDINSEHAPVVLRTFQSAKMKWADEDSRRYATLVASEAVDEASVQAGSKRFWSLRVQMKEALLHVIAAPSQSCRDDHVKASGHFYGLSDVLCI